jgi:hypothetical protein
MALKASMVVDKDLILSKVDPRIYGSTSEFPMDIRSPTGSR